MTLSVQTTRRRSSLGLLAIAGVVIGLMAVLVFRDIAGADPMDEVVFYDQFAVGDTSNVPGWEDATGPANCSVSSSDNRVVDEAARLRNDCGIAKTNVDTTQMDGLTDLHLEYDWGYLTHADPSPGDLIVEWKLSADASWNVLATHPLPANSDAPPTTSQHVDLPAGADDTMIDIRFRTTATDDGSIENMNAAFVDNIRLSANLLNPVIDEDVDGIPDDEERAECLGTPAGQSVDQYGCSLQQYIGQLNSGGGNGALTANICEAANFSLVLDTSNSINEASDLNQMKAELGDFIDIYEANGTGSYRITTFNDSANTPGGSAYQDASGAKSTLTNILNTTGQTNTSAGITTGNSLNSNGVPDNVMFVLTDGSPNLPDNGHAIDDPRRWVDAANQAIGAAATARGNFVVFAIYVGNPDSEMSLAFGDLTNANTFAAAVMDRIGGGSHESLAGFGSVSETLLNLIDCEEPQDPTRDITIEKSFAGDTPAEPLTSVSGDITPHGTWDIDLTSSDATTLTGVSTAQQSVSEDSPGSDWTVEYAVIADGQLCSEVGSWSSGPATVPSGEDDYTVCIRNIYDEPTRDITIEKIVAGDEPPSDLTSVSGDITPHGTWSIDLTSSDDTVVTGVSTAEQAVSEDNPGANWVVEYAVIADGALCADVGSWSGSATVPEGEADYTVCIRNTYSEVTRDIIIEKIVAEDDPGSPLTSVSGDITPHGPWSINLTSTNTTTISGVSTGAQTVTEDSPGSEWDVEYAVIASGASCSAVSNWDTGSASVPSGESDYRVCVRNTFEEDVIEPTRSIVIEKLVAGDTPPQPLTSVSGSVSPHGNWTINSVPGQTSVNGVNTAAQTVSENNPGANWHVEYALAASFDGSCQGISDWSSSPVNVPDGEANYKVCIRNTYIAPPAFEKSGTDYDVSEGRAQWTITVDNTSSRMQTVTISDPVAVNIVGGTPDGCSGNLASGLTCNVDAETELTFTVYKLVTQQCREQEVLNTARAYLGTSPSGDHLPGSPDENVPATVPGDPEACEDLQISKAGLGWSDGWAMWGITIDNSEQDIAHDLTINDPGAFVYSAVEECNVEEGDELVDVDCVIPAGQMVEIQVRTEVDRLETCDSGTTSNALTAVSNPQVQSGALILNLEYSIFAIQAVPGNPDLCPATVTVQKYVGEDRSGDDLLNGPQAGDALANGWDITLVCAGGDYIATGTTGSAGAGTVVFEVDPAPGECTVSEDMRDGYSGIGFYREEGDAISAGPETTDVSINMVGDADDLVIFFNTEDPDAPTATPTATDTPTATPTDDGAGSGDGPTATPTDDGGTSGGGPTPTPGVPDTGSGFNVTSNPLTLPALILVGLALFGASVAVNYSRKRTGS